MKGWLIFVVTALGFWPYVGLAQNNTPFSFDKPLSHAFLTERLLEVSGLAVASENTVYAHNDEHAIVYEINIETGEVVSAFALGDPTAEGDFEGIETVDGWIYLVDSNGLIYESLVGENRKRVHFNIYDTGIHQFCEIEGLTVATNKDEFLLLCKAAHKKEFEGRLVIFKWNRTERRPLTEPWMSIPYQNILSPEEQHDFRPSALDWDPKREAFTILSARNKMFMLLASDGTVLGKQQLAPNVHLQAEGVAIMPSGALAVADEGAGRKRGQLTIYPPVN